MVDPLVSVIIPVYNAVDHLDECLRSVAAQSIGFDRVEVVAVDDGSTDGSGALLDEWAARCPNVRVIHQANEGAPGGPRNRAVGLATGEFLFFADPDDYLGPEGLERMVAAARRNDSDVVFGRIRGVGRRPATAPFDHNVEGGDVWSTKAMWSLTTHKLFRRSFALEHRLRFAEGLRLAEEQTFVVPAYFLARSISVVADYDCYYLVRRDGFPHLTRQLPEPEPFYACIRAALETVHAHTEPGSQRNSLLRRWLQIELLGKFRQDFVRLPRDLQERWVRQARGVLEDLVPPAVVTTMPPVEHIRDRLLREGAVDKLVALAKLEAGKERGTVELTSGPVRGGTTALVRAGALLSEDRAGIQVELVCRGHGDYAGVSLSAEAVEEPDHSLTFRVPLHPRLFARPGPARGRLEFALQFRAGDKQQEMPFVVRKKHGSAGLRTLCLLGMRPVTTWAGADRAGGIRIKIDGVPEIAAALRRRIGRHLRAAKPT
jgi:Glycosyl transferase family 2